MKIKFICKNCSCTYYKWQGKCSECNNWNTIVQDTQTSTSSYQPQEVFSLDRGITLTNNSMSRIKSNIKEVDQVLGSGMVKGSAVLVGGCPGIGKSTLMLQILSKCEQESLYVSAEESLEHILMRANRLSLENKATIKVLTTNLLEEIIATVNNLKTNNILVIDSIQTIYSETIDSSPGTITQVKYCTQVLLEIARKKNIVLFIIGQVTKDGQIAGPKVLEHMVDTVLYFEDEANASFRILRAIKNRFGATNEIGILEMSKEGLIAVHNPSEIFLGNNHKPTSGSVIFSGMEGTRPILVEIQCLIVNTNMTIPRRSVVGWDINRLNMIIAVIQSRCGIFMGNKEVYLNVSGGLKITEPAMDLAVATALISAYKNKPLMESTVAFGEISLSGEIKPVSSDLLRLKESAKFGIKKAIIPSKEYKTTMDFHKIDNVKLLQQII
ncbi:DNA repair protein RadA [Anaplasmataceae bacterium AB001_6]|nr:DNA repair protein RadA [Anaplasmataceae bacterium AB001_6]